LKLAYVDTSCLIAIAFGEPGSPTLASRLRGFDRLFSSNLLEAEFRAALAREAVRPDSDALAALSWIYPNRPLTREFQRGLATARLKGADLWHVACALFLDPATSELVFLTLDRDQRTAAAALGFPT